MKIKVWIKYEEPYLPSRCRKLRYKECEEHVDVTLPEAAMEDLRLAFEDTSYNGAGKIYAYRGKLWKLAKTRDILCDPEKHTPLEALIEARENSSMFFYTSYQREYRGEDTSRARAIKDARANLRTFLLVDGDLYIQTPEPRYCIYTFGLGHNHGGTALSVDYRYNNNISRDCYFSALQGEKAVEEAIRMAVNRGDTESIDSIHAEIKVFAPDLVKINPKHQHGKGNPLLNRMNAITDAAPDALSAGLLIMAATGYPQKKEK